MNVPFEPNQALGGEPSAWQKAIGAIEQYAPHLTNAAISAAPDIIARATTPGPAGPGHASIGGSQYQAPGAFGMSYQQLIQELLRKYGQQRMGALGGGGLGQPPPISG